MCCPVTPPPLRIATYPYASMPGRSHDMPRIVSRAPFLFHRELPNHASRNCSPCHGARNLSRTLRSASHAVVFVFQQELSFHASQYCSPCRAARHRSRAPSAAPTMPCVVFQQELLSHASHYCSHAVLHAIASHPPSSAPPVGAQAKTLAVMKSVMRGMKAAMVAANRKINDMREEERAITRQLKEMDDGEDDYSDWNAPSGGGGGWRKRKREGLLVCTVSWWGCLCGRRGELACPNERTDARRWGGREEEGVGAVCVPSVGGGVKGWGGGVLVLFLLLFGFLL
jgi:hypothetical protein